MFRVLTCLTVQHDWHLVVLAVVVCLLAGGVTASLFQRAKASVGRAQSVWLSLDAAAAGFGIWATHFIAMLAYEPGVATGYNVALTILSLLIAAVITGVGLRVALAGGIGRTKAAVIGGALVGAGVCAMHFTGMLALEIPGRITWMPSLVTTSIAFGVAFAALALFVTARRDDSVHLAAGAGLFTLAVTSMHFTAMGAVVLVPDPTRPIDGLSLSPVSLSFVIAGVAALILSTSFVAAISDRQSMEKIRQQKMLLDDALDHMAQGLGMFEGDGRLLLFNKRFADLSGLPADDLQNCSVLDIMRRQGLPGSPEEFVARTMAAMREGKTTTKTVESSDGRALRVVERPRREGGWVVTMEDITDWQKAQAQIAHMARHDALTDLPNRTLFRERLVQELRRTARGERVAVFCVDLDHFKNVNDTLGHPIGDDLLKQVASRLTECVRDGDTICRLGGDEFAIVQGGQLSVRETSGFANRMIELVGAPYIVQGYQVVVGTSIGISVAPDDGRDPDQLLKNADMALYRAKIDGRGSYRYFEAGMDAEAQARRVLELDLRAALERSEFEVHYQPILNLSAGHIVCFEALVRWRHPQRGLVPPAGFIALAEETGLIVPIGNLVLNIACRDAVRWPKEISVAVNLSPVQFKDRKLVGSVLSALSESGLAANRLELEITESVLLQDNAATFATLHKLRDAGIRIAMDDFGTGYSSLSYLRSFPFDKIKIDQSFVRELASSSDAMAIVRAVTSLGKSLGVSTTAEGVETNDQLLVLRSEGCSEAQGFLFGKPVPAAEVEQMLFKSRLRVVA
jgi:diguanylate cyclase (GGDEF)-like protein/PAS domain S-box-containing protein